MDMDMDIDVNVDIDIDVNVDLDLDHILHTHAVLSEPPYATDTKSRRV